MPATIITLRLPSWLTRNIAWEGLLEDGGSNSSDMLSGSANSRSWPVVVSAPGP